jgi:Gly-Xaa carboxypeptidase
MAKKGETSLPFNNAPPKRTIPWGGKVLASIGLSALLLLSYTAPTPWTVAVTGNEEFTSTSCHQAEPLVPRLIDTLDIVTGQEGRIRDWLSGSVKIPTEMFDVMGPIGEDPRWDIFYNFSSCMSLSQPYRVELIGKIWKNNSRKSTKT